MRKIEYFCDVCGNKVKDGLDLVKMSLQRFDIRDLDDVTEVCKACRTNIVSLITGMRKKS